jgi:hypothetical protein
MCTLIIGRDILGSGSVVLAANRDERPDRDSEAPVVLAETPRVIGGRDRVAGGTWLAVREARAVVAVLNRPDPLSDQPPAGRRSRGLLALDVARVPSGYTLELEPGDERREMLDRMRERCGPGLAYAALCRVFSALWADVYAPFSLLYAGAEGAWVVSQEGDAGPRFQAIPAGWHVITHADLDDEGEPRTARLLYELAYFRPLSLEKAEQRLADLLRSHGSTRGTGREAEVVPPVCLHDGVMRTVSATLVTLTPTGARLLHADGRPCERRFEDRSSLLNAPAIADDAER